MIGPLTLTLLKAIDVNGDGSLSLSEISWALTDLGLEVVGLSWGVEERVECGVWRVKSEG